MPKLVLKRKTTSASNTLSGTETGAQTLAAKEAARTPTLEELREKYAVGTLGRVKIEAVEYGNLKIAASEAGNAANRQKTKLKAAIKQVLRDEKLGPDDKLIVGDEEYRFDVTHSDKIDVDAFVKMFEDGKIPRDKFVESIAVLKADAERNIGAHILNGITDFVDGKTADVRISSYDGNVTEEPRIVRAREKAHAKAIKPKPLSEKAVPQRTGGLRRRRIVQL